MNSVKLTTREKKRRTEAYDALTGLITSMDADDCDLTKLPPIRLGTL